MDLASLQVFQTVVREQSFSRAAEKLFRTQPAVSISIRKLEEWVGQPLFVSGSGARLLTDAGTLLLDYADRMLNLREEIRKSMRELKGLERGQISIGVNESSIHALLPALAQYRKLHPGIHIRVHRVFSRDVPREVLSHQLDIGVISYIPEENELSAVEFYRDSLALVVWPGHRLAKRREVIFPSWARKRSSRTSWNLLSGSAWFKCSRGITFRCGCISRCRRSRASSCSWNEDGSGHRAADVRGRRNRPRHPEGIADPADENAAEALSDIPRDRPLTVSAQALVEILRHSTGVPRRGAQPNAWSANPAEP